eukprot:TRINITY_DN574_c0_g2_i2.p1 TRINITY_DN574_c0_g2~~TRINITY_DN574_c0_g2_i2.p1  ORF type:complete len:532 (-),score=83.97 TRINITY_DN574_c0_g2_i2:942-2537(-)
MPKNKGKKQERNEDEEGVEPTTTAETQSLQEVYPYVHHDLFAQFRRLPPAQTVWQREKINPPCTPEVLFDAKKEGNASMKYLLYDSMPPEQQKEYKVKARKLLTDFESFFVRFFRGFLVEPRKMIELVVGILSHYHPHVRKDVYMNAIYIVVPLMPHLTEEDCRAIISNLNETSFYFNPKTGKPAVFEPSTDPDCDPFGYEGEHLFVDKYYPLVYASEIFMKTYVKMVLDKNFWVHETRHKNAIVMFTSMDSDLIIFKAPHFSTLLLDFFSCVLVRNDVNYMMDDVVSNICFSGLFVKVLPLMKLGYQEERIEPVTVGHYIHLLRRRDVKPADCDKPFLVRECNKVSVCCRVKEREKAIRAAKREYMEDLYHLCQMDDWKMLSDEVECNFIGCNVVKKFKDLTQHSSDEVNEKPLQQIDHANKLNNNNHNNNNNISTANNENTESSKNITNSETNQNPPTDQNRASNSDTPSISLSSSFVTTTVNAPISYMLRCGKCKARYYCSVECQQKSWISGHKILCSHIASVSKYKL